MLLDCLYQKIIVDVLLVAGLNDILHDIEPEDIIEESEAGFCCCMTSPAS